MLCVVCVVVLFVDLFECCGGCVGVLWDVDFDYCG